MTELLQQLKVRPACENDLDMLTQALGQNQYFAQRIRDQCERRGLLFAAWKQDRPVGDVYVRLDVAEEAKIRRLLPGVPFLTHLEVLEPHRNRGIGTSLIETAEQFLRESGEGRVALAVDVTNIHAARLYRRLGYVNWGSGHVACQSVFDGPAREEWCEVLVKRLSP